MSEAKRRLLFLFSPLCQQFCCGCGAASRPRPWSCADVLHAPFQFFEDMALLLLSANSKLHKGPLKAEASDTDSRHQRGAGVNAMQYNTKQNSFISVCADYNSLVRSCSVFSSISRDCEGDAFTHAPEPWKRTIPWLHVDRNVRASGAVGARSSLFAFALPVAIEFFILYDIFCSCRVAIGFFYISLICTIRSTLGLAKSQYIWMRASGRKKSCNIHACWLIWKGVWSGGTYQCPIVTFYSFFYSISGNVNKS